MTYTGEYAKSAGDTYRSYGLHYYRNAETNEVFEVRSDTGVLARYTVPVDANTYALETVSDPEAFALDKAKRIAQELLGSIDAYDIFTEVDAYTVTVDGEEKTLNIYKTRFISGVQTSDYCIIRITEKGTLRSAYVSEAGFFNGLKISKGATERINQAIDRKITDTFGLSDYAYSNYEITSQVLERTPDGKNILVSMAAVYFEDTNGEVKKAVVGLSTEL